MGVTWQRQPGQQPEQQPQQEQQPEQPEQPEQQQQQQGQQQRQQQEEEQYAAVPPAIPQYRLSAEQFAAPPLLQQQPCWHAAPPPRDQEQWEQ